MLALALIVASHSTGTLCGISMAGPPYKADLSIAVAIQSPIQHEAVSMGVTRHQTRMEGSSVNISSGDARVRLTGWAVCNLKHGFRGCVSRSENNGSSTSPMPIIPSSRLYTDGPGTSLQENPLAGTEERNRNCNEPARVLRSMDMDSSAIKGRRRISYLI